MIQLENNLSEIDTCDIFEKILKRFLLEARFEKGTNWMFERKADITLS